jgi:hypothetical protein
VADSGAVLSGAVDGVSKVEGVGGRTASTCFTRELISAIVESVMSQDVDIQCSRSLLVLTHS